MTVVLAVAPGGGTDILARVMAKYFRTYLPGNPVVVVRNMIGGGGTIGANYAYAAKPDGLTIFYSSATPNTAYMTGMSAVKFDLKKMDAIVASPTGDVYYIRPGIVARTEDLPRASGINFGGAPGAIGYFFCTAAELLNIPLQKVTLAYTGSADGRRAFLAGEINTTGDSSPQYAEIYEDYVKKGEVQVLFQSGVHDDKGVLVGDPLLPKDMINVKEVYQKLYGKAPSGIMWEAYNTLIATIGTYAKVMLLPPGTPSNITSAYWDAAAKMVADPEFLKVVDPLVGAKAAWVTGKACDSDFKAKMTMDPKVIEWIKDTFSKKYGVVF